MFEVYFAILLCVISAVFYLRTRTCKPPRPPGPSGYPFIGSILDIETKKTYLSFQLLAEEYGEIYSLKLLHKRYVVLSSYEAITAACLKEPMATIFSDRPPLIGGKLLFYNQSDVITGRAGSHHTKLRKITHKLLKSYGDGIRRIECIAVDELRNVVQKFHDTNGQSFDPFQFIHTSVSNIICSLLIGKTFDDDDREIKAIKNFVFETNKLTTPVLNLLLTSLPVLSHIPPFRKIIQEALRSKDEFIDAFVNQSRENLDSGHIRGIIDELLLNPEITERDTEVITLDFMGAGSATTHSALMCTMLTLIYHQDVQRRIQIEVDDVIGTERLPSNQDRFKMPYTQAMILESLRLSSHVPLSIPHYSTEDCIFMGYFIQKNSMIIMNTWAVNHDEKLWGDPWNFRPERFLDENGALLPSDHKFRKSMLIFGLGKRSCIGELVAHIRIFLFVVSLLQQFTLKPGEGCALSADPRNYQTGIVLHPQPYTLRAVPRK